MTGGAVAPPPVSAPASLRFLRLGQRKKKIIYFPISVT